MITLPQILELGISEVSSIVGLPGASTVSLAIAEVRTRKREQARDLFFEELRHGRLRPSQIALDETVSVVARYLRAADEGAARINLRLLAKAIVGGLATSRLVADEFLTKADMLSALSREEVLVIGTLFRHSLSPSKPGEPDFVGIHDAWSTTQAVLAERGMDSRTVYAVASRAQRSGLIFIGPTVDEGGIFQVSPAMEELSKTVDFLDALAKEGMA